MFEKEFSFFSIISDIDLILEKEKRNVWVCAEEEIQWDKLGQGISKVQLARAMRHI